MTRAGAIPHASEAMHPKPRGASKFGPGLHPSATASGKSEGWCLGEGAPNSEFRDRDGGSGEVITALAVASCSVLGKDKDNRITPRGWHHL